MERQSPFKVYTERWYTLAVFSYIAALQCLVWNTFSQAPVYVGRYYGLISKNHTDCDGRCASVTNLLLVWGPLLFIPVSPIAVWILTKPSGIKNVIRLGSTLTFLGCIIRMLPCLFMTEAQRLTVPWYMIALLHTGQMLNAISGGLVLAGPSKVSERWFAAEQRTTATAIMSIANGIGGTVGFLLCPAIVHSEDDIPRLLYIQAGIAAVPMIASMIRLSDGPPSPPSHAAHRSISVDIVPCNTVYEQQSVNCDNEELSSQKLTFFQELALMTTMKPFLWFAFCSGLASGVAAIWLSIIQVILGPFLGQRYSTDKAQSAIGLIGFLEGIGQIVGGVVTGPVCDRYYQGRIKVLLAILYVFAILTLAAITVVLPFSHYHMHIIHGDKTKQASPLVALPHEHDMDLIILNILFTAFGVFQGSQLPLFYELGVEMTFPIEAGTSSGLYVLLFNIFAVIPLLVTQFGSGFLTSYMNLVTLAVTVFCFLALLITPTKYKRLEAERKVKSF
eukprot:m.342615 g.342615  ORF g.342615 m.342615 type:complete len:504 (-) comp21626_c0_seq1:150-1661(-)